MRLIHRAVALAVAALAIAALPGAAFAKDGNHDRIPDRWEKRHRLSLAVNQAGRDQDRDHLRNRAEFLAGDNPRDRDSDDDGVADGSENAGTIQSFDAETGKLTIVLFGGETLTGIVNEETEIKCPPSEEATTASASHEGVDEPGDSGEEEPGDDHSGESPGDDDGEHSGPGSSSSDPGHDDEHGDCHEGNCTTAALVPGATVEEADVHLANGVATFEEVELAG